MKVKDILKHYDGNFYIYKDNFIKENVLLADHNTSEICLKAIKKAKVKYVFTGNFFLEIYI